jgi:hypothetical protein
MENSMDELDISWTNEYLRTTEGGITYESELMNSISIKFLYVNTENDVIHMINDKVSLKIKDNSHSLLDESTLIDLSYKYRDHNDKRYKCSHIVKYFIPTAPQTIIDNINDPAFTFNEKDCLTVFDLPKDISFSPSLFIFHSINTVYMFFHEMVLVNPISPVSIIKKHNKKHTKRVRISDELPTTIQNRKTRKAK